MTQGELWYLGLILAAFGVFMLTLAATSWAEQHGSR